MADFPKIKVLIVDDSLFMRRLLTDLLEKEDGIEVIGEAKDGLEAIEKNKSLEPDVITMDYNMPEMDGVLSTKTIMQGKGHVPAIIILSAYTDEGVKETLEGLRLGAVDFVSKPSGELSLDIEDIKEELISKIKVAFHSMKESSALGEKQNVEISKIVGDKEIVVIGASTGGPPVVEKIIAAMPSDLNATVLVVQHMPEKFTSKFADLINRNSSIETREAKEGDVIKKGECLVAPSGMHMVIEFFQDGKKDIQKIVHLTKEPKVNGYRPSIDVLMNSVANKYKSQAIGIVLTGMGVDGTAGMKAIKQNGGYTIAQSPKSAVIESMPLSVIKHSEPDEVLTPETIVERIVRACSRL